MDVRGGRDGVRIQIIDRNRVRELSVKEGNEEVVTLPEKSVVVDEYDKRIEVENPRSAGPDTIIQRVKSGTIEKKVTPVVKVFNRGLVEIHGHEDGIVVPGPDGHAIIHQGGDDK